MEITSKLIETIQILKNSGLDGKEVQERLNLPQNADEIVRKFEAEREGLLTAQAVADLLTKELSKTKEEFNYDKVLRLARKGKLNIHQQRIAESGKAYKRAGMLFHVEDIQAFIDEKLVTKEDLLEENKKLKKEIEKLKEHLQAAIPATHLEDEKQVLQEEAKEEGALSLLEEEKRELEHSGDSENEETFDFGRVEVKYPKKPKELGGNRYAIDVTLNGQRFTTTVSKEQNGLVLLGGESLEGAAVHFNADTHPEFLAELEKALIPKVEKKINKEKKEDGPI